MIITEFFKVCNNVIKLDVYDMVYEFSSEKLNTLSFFPIKRIGILNRFLVYIWHLLGSMGCLWKSDIRIIPNSMVFFVCSKNERDAIYPIYNSTKNSCLIDTIGGNNFKLFWAYLIGILFFPLIYFKYIFSRHYRRKSIRHVFDHYLISYGLYIYSYIWMKLVMPKAIILSNHTNTINRVILTVAKDLYIKTMYVQHASVTDNFPPLTFDYALLEGMDSLNKYSKSGYTNTKIFLIGMPKYDYYIKYTNRNLNVRSIGICLNAIDSIDRILEICKVIRNDFPTIKMIIRPYGIIKHHSEWDILYNKFNITFSDFNKEKSFDFLQNVDAIISGESNIILEAALMNVFPIYYDSIMQKMDYYGFIKNGIVKYSSEPSEVCDILKETLHVKPSVREKAKLYCHTIDTVYDGHSTELACDVMKYLNSKEGDKYEKWIRIRNIDIEAYECIFSENGNSAISRAVFPGEVGCLTQDKND